MSVIKVCVCSFLLKFARRLASQLHQAHYKSQLRGAHIGIYDAVEERVTYEDDEYKIYVQ
jgi:hypothetical protein